MNEISRVVSVVALFISGVALALAFDLIQPWLAVILLLPLPIFALVLIFQWLRPLFRRERH